MTFETAVIRDGRHTRVTVQGAASVGQLLSLLSVLQLEAAHWPAGEVLLDLTGVDNGWTPAERSRIDDAARRHLGSAGVVTVRWRGGS